MGYDDRMAKHNRFVRARELAGFNTVYAACKEMRGVGRQSVMDLESDPSIASRLKATTAWEILRAYHPHLGLRDFFGERARGFEVRPIE